MNQIGECAEAATNIKWDYLNRRHHCAALVLPSIWRVCVWNFHCSKNPCITFWTSQSTQMALLSPKTVWCFCWSAWMSYCLEQLNVNLCKNDWCAHWHPTAEKKGMNSECPNWPFSTSTVDARRIWTDPASCLHGQSHIHLNRLGRPCLFRFFFCILLCGCVTTRTRTHRYHSEHRIQSASHLVFSLSLSHRSSVRWAIESKLEILDENTMNEYTYQPTVVGKRQEEREKKKIADTQTFDELRWQVCDRVEQWSAGKFHAVGLSCASERAQNCSNCSQCATVCVCTPLVAIRTFYRVANGMEK